jgi:hypothetical protein
MNTEPLTIEARIKEFADLCWPDRDLPGRLRKLGEEVGELNEAVCHFQQHLVYQEIAKSNDQEELDLFHDWVLTEIADCAIILQDMIGLMGHSEPLTDLMTAKMEVNECREWPQEDEGSE